MSKPVFQLNHRTYPYQEGATVSSIMAENNYDFSAIVVKINGVVIDEELWKEAAIDAGDNVEIIHIFGGG